MSERDIALIDELRTTENALVEFKKDNIDPKLIAKLCSALSNAARIEEKDFAYVMWGIDDATHEVVGTRFNPEDVKTGSNTVLQSRIVGMRKKAMPLLLRSLMLHKQQQSSMRR